MKRSIGILMIGAVIVGMVVLLGGVAVALVPKAEAEPMQRKIIVFKSGILNESARDALLAKFGAVKVKDLSLIDAKAILLPPKAAMSLARHAGILRIDEDIEVFALAKPGKTAAPQPTEVLPWGIDRVDAELVWPLGNTADPVKVAIIDTGIDVAHPDLKENLKGGVSTVGYTSSYKDDNGHGTHVAGITAAVDNTIGVIGVGPKIDLYAVKVLNRRGSGYLSDVIEGLDWAIQNKMQVVNMSLGAASDIQSFHDAVIRVSQAGITQVAAAGNSGGAVAYPAAYPEVIAVSATDKNNVIASWSSRGSEVDLAAPGVDIHSTYKGSTYKTMSGTSMAAPHVAGAVALVLNSLIGSYDIDADGVWDPAEVQQKLQDRTVDLGGPGFDNLYGWGLVNVYNAIQP